MEKINYFSSIFTAEENNGMGQQLVTAVEKSGTTNEKLLQVIGKLKTNNDKLTNVLNSMKKNPFTNALGDANEWHSSVFVGGKTVIHGMTYYVFDENIKTAAERLEEVIRRHGWGLQDYRQQDRTSASNSLIAELLHTENQTDLTTIGQMPWFNAFVKAQNNFELVFNDKANHESKKESKEKKKAMLPVVNAIENLVLYINSELLFETADEALINIFETINGIILETSRSSRLRRSGKNTRENEETTSTETTTEK